MRDDVITTREVRYTTDAEGREVVDGFTAEFRHFRDGDEPDVVLEVDVVDGQPIVVEVTVRKHEGVTSRALRIPVESYLQYVLGLKIPDRLIGDPVHRRMHLPPEVSTRRKRRVLTDSFLRAVVDAYIAGGHSIAGVSPDADPRFHASDSQKFRWIKAARERGLLTEGEGG